MVQGATCKCQFGTAPDKLKVLTQSRRYANDKDGSKKLVATHKDIGQPFEKNTFGSCARLNGSPASLQLPPGATTMIKLPLRIMAVKCCSKE